MIANSQEKAARGGLDTNQLLKVVDHPPGREQTLCAFRAFTAGENYVEAARELNRGDAAKLVDEFDQVCHGGLQDALALTTYDQAIGPVDSKMSQDMALLRALGTICSATTQLPYTTILSDGLKKCGEIAIASGGFTDTWRGLYRSKNVALKAFRTYPIQDLKEAEKVCHTTRVNVALTFR